jgi:lysylphosphatidylglycerol synthetase-like protein (DUF2156 family)
VIAAIDDIRQRTWDFGLTIATMLLLATLGLQSFLGTLLVWAAIRAVPGWEQSAAYTNYVDAMNAIAAPQVVALVVVMGLCVPKRLFARRVLLWVSIAMLAVAVVSGVVLNSLTDGLAIYLLLSAAIQLAVVVMTIAGVRGPSYLTEGRLTKTGSGLLHLGFIVFAIVVVALQKSPMMMPVFTLSAVLVTVGTTMSFYAWRIAWHRSDTEREIEFDWHESAVAEEDESPEAAEESDASTPDAATPPESSESPTGADDSAE